MSFPYGVIEARLAKDDLADNRIRFDRLHVAMPSGIVFRFPQDAELPSLDKDRIDWGIQMDMSGPTSESQSTYVKGFQDFMRMTNEAGGINGRKINVLAEDNRFNAATDKIIHEKFVSQTPVLGISGMGSSGGGTPAEPEKKKKCKGPLGIPLPTC